MRLIWLFFRLADVVGVIQARSWCSAYKATNRLLVYNLGIKVLFHGRLYAIYAEGIWQSVYMEVVVRRQGVSWLLASDTLRYNEYNCIRKLVTKTFCYVYKKLRHGHTAFEGI